MAWTARREGSRDERLELEHIARAEERWLLFFQRNNATLSLPAARDCTFGKLNHAPTATPADFSTIPSQFAG